MSRSTVSFARRGFHDPLASPFIGVRRALFVPARRGLKRMVAGCTLAWGLLGCGSSPTATGSASGGVSTTLASVTQAELDALGSALRFELAVVDNRPDTCPPGAPFGACHDARITLRNTGPELRSGGFSLFYTSGHRVLGASSNAFRIRHVTGTLHVIEPTAAFQGWSAGEAISIGLQAGLCMNAESDAQPRAYLAAPGLRAVVIANTDSEDPSGWLEPLLSEAQARCPGDRSVLATAATRFEDNARVQDLGAAASVAEIVPSPLSATVTEGALDLSKGLALDALALGAETLAALNDDLGALGLAPQPGAATVTVTVDPADAAFAGRATAQAYRLRTTADGAQIVGADAAGAFYGVESLLALVPPMGTAARAVPLLEIPYDAPRYGYRGLHLDVSRNFHGLPEVLRLLRWMAAYKLDALRLHLSDDEGFRLEVPGLPELTDLGARRCHSEVEGECLEPQLGSGPFDDTSGSGFFTRDDFITLLRAATARHIEVVPGFDMPAHSRAAVRALALRRTHGDASFALDDPEDASDYLSTQSYRDNVVNVCEDSAYAFVARLMDEVGAMYREAEAPLRTWHVGSDEVPEGAWARSPACAALIASGAVQSTSSLQAYFIARVNALAAERGIGLRAWTEGWQQAPPQSPGGAPSFLDPATALGGNAVSVNWWSPLASFFDGLGPLTRLGYRIVLSSGDFTLLDHVQEADPKERGLAWAARFNDTSKLFSYLPGNLAADAQLTPECAEGACASALAAATPIATPDSVLGLEAHLWSETIRTDDELEYMLFPRLLALAERAWHRAAWEPPDGMDAAAPLDRAALAADWQRFANLLGHKELPKLEQAGVRFRIDVPGGTIQDGSLHANVASPGLALEYQAGDGEFLPYEPANPPSLASTMLRATTLNGRAGRAVPVP